MPSIRSTEILVRNVKSPFLILSIICFVVIKGNLLYGEAADLRETEVKKTSQVTETKDRTLTAATAQEIQDAVDSVGKHIASGVRVTIQIDNGAYDLVNTIKITGFYGGGMLLLQGDTTENMANELHTTQNVHLNGASLAGNVLVIEACSLKNVAIKNLKISYNASGGNQGIRADRNIFTGIYYCFFLGNGTEAPSGNGIYVLWQPCYVVKTCFTSGHSAVKGTELATVKIDKCSDTGTPPQYGVMVEDALAFIEGSQPAGSAANIKKVRGEVYY
jgi:hypothetical protein